MNALVDANILVRLSDSGHPIQPVCELALQRLPWSHLCRASRCPIAPGGSRMERLASGWVFALAQAILPGMPGF